MNPKAIALLSGGLDSTLALRLILDQGIEVEALNFVTPFCNCNRGGEGCAAKHVADALDVPCKTIAVTDEFFRVIKNPRYGYGSGMNPCLDCRILMFSRARERMEEIGAAFVFTGEVLGQRPMSQHRRAMRTIERESGLTGRLLRPLSAQLLEPTIPEEEGLVDREKLLALQGRSRRPQMTLAEEHSITDYPCPAGGCLLTDISFAQRMRDLIRFRPDFCLNDVNLLKVGRHFRLSPGVKVVVGRNEEENHRLQHLARQGDLLFEVKNYGSPITLLRGKADEGESVLAAAITARYSDAEGDVVQVSWGTDCAALNKIILTLPLEEDELTQLRI
ncbi:MAG: 7-cyano-7-deazaguanine synthase [Anaerolineae bacterium]